MDRTTLSRNLKPLEKARLVRLGSEGWKRSKTVHVTSEGRQRLTRAASLWETAQTVRGSHGSRRYGGNLQ